MRRTDAPSPDLRQNGSVTDSAPTTPTPLPPDPAKYDEVRNEHARRRGLPQAYIAGGDDPELEATLRRERRYVRLLVWMIIVIVAGGFVLGFLAALLGVPL
jgi:hypothetical protein